MKAVSLVALLAALTWSSSARAFCGFYVSGGGADLFNDASMVVLMRDGTRTVLSMQNNYRGPTEDFALVIPVPVVLQKANVKTLPNEVFARLDTLAAPRLVEEYEPGQCPPPPPSSAPMPPSVARNQPLPRDLGVTVEAKFEVAEYDIVILSAKYSVGLEIWLNENKYKVPKNVAPLLKPYTETNWKFFVAKVNAKKVKFVDGQAVLSPLRFFYDSEKFELPVRLGLANSGGTQDLIVHVIAKSRYELANAKNVLVPTNVRLKPNVQPEFGGWYVNLLERTFEKNPGAAITEFAWKGALPPPKNMVQQGIYGVTCDPCPPPEPVDDPLARYLGADALPGVKTDEDVAQFAQQATVTRLHLRYTKESLTSDLVFKAASPIAGGIPEQAQPGPAQNNRFQGRYIVRKPFDSSRCYMGGGMARPMLPPGLAMASTPAAPTKKTLSVPFESVLLTDLPELGLKAAK